MAIHPIDFRYGTPEMRSIFEEEKKLEKMLLVEAALVEALADLGKVPKEAAVEVKKKANTKDVKLERVKEIEAEIKHDVMAIAKALTEVSGESGKYVHLTATSYDIQDTATALQIKEAMNLIIKKSETLLATCLSIAEKHKKQVMIGRTHGQHAVPITLGFKFANYSDKLGEDILRLKEDSKYIQGKFSGAVGNYSAQQNLGVGEELESRIMKKLNITASDITMQTVPREHLARIVSDIVILASTVDQIAREIRNLQRSEIGEVSEPFGSKQVGSSTMAQKKNPIDCENVCSNVRVIRSCLTPVIENIALEHERDLTNSAAERSLLPTVFILTDEVLTRMNKILSGIVVFPKNMKKNLEMSKGTIMAEAVITKLTENGMGRQDAHEILRTASMEALEQDKHLRDILKKNSDVMKHLSAVELENLFNYENYVGLSVEKTDKILKKWGKNANYKSNEPAIEVNVKRKG